MAGHPVTDFENRYLRKDGTVVDVLWSGLLVGKRSGAFPGGAGSPIANGPEVRAAKIESPAGSAHQATQLIMDNSEDVICSLHAAGLFPNDERCLT